MLSQFLCLQDRCVFKVMKITRHKNETAHCLAMHAKAVSNLSLPSFFVVLRIITFFCFASCWSAASPPTPAVNAGLSSLPPNHPKWLQAPPPVASASSPPLNRHGRACMLAFRRGQARLANASGRRSQVAHGRRSLYV
ncbi:hypothetical protein C2845_PM14G03740 [Panicum miliaceum]|uniref:Uncharacterized protein n=1 Tax=Panicum miliaceum TaxID=4540 RepID=A0A3L6PUC8_PANMI|nr:hypothetical protein C2845_PM14G03740 [Panicum miliaceum]